MKQALSVGVLELPGTWSDESVFAFVHEDSLPIPLLAAKSVEVLSIRTSLAMRRILTNKVSLEDVMTLQITELRHRGLQVSLGDEPRWVHGTYGEVPTTSLNLVIGELKVRQVSVFVPWREPHTFTMLVFSAPVETFDSARSLFTKAFASFRLPD